MPPADGDNPEFRIGTGFDVHRLVPGRRLVLAGVTIPWELGLLGHSDADVITHAVMDALLGALALGDIGHWFPPGNPAWRGADSLEMLRSLLRSPHFAGWTLVNTDVTLLAERPKIRPYHEAMRERLAAALGLPVARVSIKATTTEGLGFTGRAEGMAAQAVALLTRRAAAGSEAPCPA
ncbi:MAG: 2-C-methyl-D-erythritol 2,4-cyclodiphosphate synthase [Lentisphaeria bacterium]|jgi:2-C-methyl-D-erythritol 2,4-cyclodiphosphate synthase